LEMLKDHTDGKTFDKLKEKFAVWVDCGWDV
jgi:hypothetical protein